MIIKWEPAKVQLDTAGLIEEIKYYVTLAMEKIEEKWIEVMKQEIDATSSSPGAWREELAGRLRHLNEEITATYIEYVVGAYEHSEDSSYDYLRAMVVTYGMGSASDFGGDPIYAGPFERIVYDNNLSGQHPSRVPGKGYLMPASWNHAGGHFLDNSIKIMTSIVSETAQEVMDMIPGDIIAKHLTVSL